MPSAARVKAVLEYEVDMIAEMNVKTMDGERTIQLTGNHRVYVNEAKSFISVYDFNRQQSISGKLVIVFDSKRKLLELAKVESVHFRILKEKSRVYDLVLEEGPHNFLADGLLVHNADSLRVKGL